MGRGVFLLLWLLLLWGCGGGIVFYEKGSGDVCGRVKVPLVLASKVVEEDRRGANMHVWRVVLRCRLWTEEKEGVKERKIENLEVILTLKGFVESAGVAYEMDVPYVVMAKDEAKGEVLGKESGKVGVKVLRNEGSGEEEVRVFFDLKEFGEDKRLYPTVFVGLGLSPKDWRRYKDVVEETGERALLPGVAE